MTTVLTGGETVFGTAQDNTQTDSFIDMGAGNTIFEGGGNLNVLGTNVGQGYDTQTTINLGDAVQVTDKIVLDGAGNVIQAGAAGDYLSGSTVSIKVTGLGLPLAQQGHNVVNLDNVSGTTNLSLTGRMNAIRLNSDATNTIVAGAGHAQVSVGAGDDYHFNFSTAIRLTGLKNTVTAGDQNVTISGSGTDSTVNVGDGNNSINLVGTGNRITAWGGTNIINAGSGHDTVTFLGSHGANGATFVYDPNIPIVGPPTDTVQLAGAGDKLSATYENVVVNGSAVTGGAVLAFGIGNNAVTLGGDASTLTFGDAVYGSGTNNISFSGSDNSVTVTDTLGNGTDNLTVGNGDSNSISFDFAGGSVAGTSFGETTVDQNAAAIRVVDIALNDGIGFISLGNGSDLIVANGNGSVIIAGNGNDVVTANGGGTSVTLGNGNDSVSANGASAVVVAGYGADTVVANGSARVTLGDGNDNVTANGGGAKVTVGNGTDTINANGAGAVVTAGSGNDLVNANGNGAHVTLGNGNDTISAVGGNAVVVAGYGKDTITIGNTSTLTLNGTVQSIDIVTAGNGNTIRFAGGADFLNGGAGNTVYMNACVGGASNLQFSGNNNSVLLGTDASVSMLFNQAGTGENVLIQADTGNTYGGLVAISDFGIGDVMTLNGLTGGVDGHALNSYAEVLDNITAGPQFATLHLGGGGSVEFFAVTGFKSSEFAFGTHTGAV